MSLSNKKDKYYISNKLGELRDEVWGLTNNVHDELAKPIVDTIYDDILEELHGLWLELKWTKDEIYHLERKL